MEHRAHYANCNLCERRCGGNRLAGDRGFCKAGPPEQQNHIIFQLSNSLQAIIAQNLRPRADGKGQVMACEICVATPAIRKLIRDGESHLLINEIQTGKKFQMQSMDAALQELYQRGEITYDAAVSCARDQNQFKHKVG